MAALGAHLRGAAACLHRQPRRTQLVAPIVYKGARPRCCNQPTDPPRRSSRPSSSSRQRAVRACAILRTSTSNPSLTNANWDALGTSRGGSSGGRMTVDGTMNKAALLLLMAMATAACTWTQIFSGNAAAAMGALTASKAGGVVGFGAILVSMFKPQWAQYTAPTYAICKGVALAGMSAMLELSYPGIAMNTVLVTFSTAASLFFALKTRLIRVTDRFMDTVKAVTGGYFVAILLTFLGSMVGLRLPGLFSGGPIAIGISLVGAGLAAANLLLDFDWIEQAADARAPAALEWYGAQSLLLTLVWLYSEVLRLLWMLAGNRGDD